ncbi:putative RNA-directed DNA polymerase, eukaryota, reverse transcriptase zinc-binding domain protein [Tanacetum coccineum]
MARSPDMAVNEVVSNNSKPPGFENFIKENKACSRLSSNSRAGKCSTSFANYSRKDLKGFSFIDEMNRMIEVGGDFGYDEAFLESMVYMDEIEAAVWDCGSQKASGSNGYSFMFIKKFWDILKHDIQSFVVPFFSTGTFPQSSNSAFITLIPKVSNPLFIKDYRPISLIGIHYNIVAKILANRLAKVRDSIISPKQFAFITGRKILDGPLILSETIDWYNKCKKKMMLLKVDFKKAFDSMSWRGLRQGDPLSPFIFIIVMKGLHMALNDSLAANMFNGVKVGSSVGVSSNEVEIMASYTGCEAGFFPFTYLGLPIGSNIIRIVNWQPLIDHFKARLSGWKANLLSIDGRLLSSNLCSIALELVLPQYAVSIKKIRHIRAYTSPDATKDSSLIRRIHELLYAVSKDYYTRRFWKISNVVPTPRKLNTSYPTSVDTAYRTDYQTLYIDDPKLNFRHASESLNHQVDQESIRRAYKVRKEPQDHRKTLVIFAQPNTRSIEVTLL